MTGSAAEATATAFTAPITKAAQDTVAKQDGGSIEPPVEQSPPQPLSDRLAAASGPALSFIASWAMRLGALSIGVLIWHLAVENKFNFYINFENVPGPTRVFASLLTHLAGSEFYIHIAVSMQRILIGYTLATIIGILIGLMMGRSRLARDLVMPYVEIIRPIPAVAWIPLAILMWPTEESSIIYITFLGALFPIILNTLHGVEQTPEVLVRAARSLGARRMQIFRHVVLPAALPSIAAGLAIGMGVSWFSLLAGEIISGQYGIGYFTWNAYSLINYPDIVVGMLCIGLLGTGSTYAVRLATRPFLKWQRRTR
ncbi:MAG: ABC transporter permease [Rhodomicrobiaceae bacterium]